LQLNINMPNKIRRDKRRKSPLRNAANPRPTRIDSVKALLAQRAPALTRVTDQAARVRFWQSWLLENMSPQLQARISGVSEHDGALVVFAESAAWCARLRFAVAELEGAMRAAAPQLTAIAVRVLPRR
jgi:hypothetical protein